MASPSAGHNWTWDPARGEYFYWVPERNCFVYQSGFELRAQQQAAPGSTPQGAPVQTSPRDSSTLEGAFRNFSIDDPASHHRSASQSSSGDYTTNPQTTTSNVSGYGPASTTSAYTYSTVPVSTPYPYGSGGQPGPYGNTYPTTAQPSYGTTYQQHIQPGPSTQHYPWGLIQNPDGVQRALQGPPVEDITPQDLLQQGVWAGKKVMATAGDKEKLDRRYKRQGKDFFQFGKVFRVLWAESAGDAPSGISIVTGRFGESIHTKIRWFVVLRAEPQENSCTALPIQTYGGQGVSKAGVIKNHHAIIYTGSRPPTPLSGELPRPPNEHGMRESIRVTARKPSDKLDAMSRVNYIKVVTVETNIKAYDFGNVHKDSLNVLWGDFWAVWNSYRLSGPPLGQGSSSSAVATATAPSTYAAPAPPATQSLNSVQEEDDDDEDGSSAGGEETDQ